jgi:hypothetical protein
VHGERCLSPTSATDLRSRAPRTDPPIPVRTCFLSPLAGRHPSRGSSAAHRSAFGRWTSGRSTGGASLDGDPPASAIAHDPFPACAWGLIPVRARRRGRRAVLAELRSKAPPRDTSRSRRFRPRTELVTWPLTPSVATRASRRRLGILREERTEAASAVPPDPPHPAASSRAAELAGPERLPSTMNPSASPRFTGAVARASPWPRITGIPALPCGIAAARTRRFRRSMHAATLHGPRHLAVSDKALRAGHDASSPLCAKQKPLCTRQNRAGRLPSRA